MITCHSDSMIHDNNIIASVESSEGITFQSYVEVAIIGAGACGLTAALAAKERTDDIIILERDARLVALPRCLQGLFLLQVQWYKKKNA